MLGSDWSRGPRSLGEFTHLESAPAIRGRGPANKHFAASSGGDGCRHSETPCVWGAFVRPSDSVKLQRDRAQVCAAQCPGLVPWRPCSQVAELPMSNEEDVMMRPPIVGFIIHRCDRGFAPSPPFPRTHSRFRRACEACCCRRLWAGRQVYCRAMRNGFAGSI